MPDGRILGLVMALTEKDLPKACTLGPEKVLIAETPPGFVDCFSSGLLN